MVSITKILFPTDFSEDAEKSLHYLIHLANVLSADIVLYHAYSCPAYASDVPFEWLGEQCTIIASSRKASMDKLLIQCYDLNAQLRIYPIVQEGNLIDTIDEIVKAEKIDLIVMGTQGAGVVKGFFTSTNAAKVIATSSCPVFVIPKGQSFKPLTNILFSSEYHDSDIYDLEYLISLAKKFQATITILNISDEEELIQSIFTSEFKKEVRRLIKYPNIRFVCTSGRHINERILEYAESMAADLIVMSSRHRKKLEKIYDRSHTQQIAQRTSIPLLAFHIESIIEIK